MKLNWKKIIAVTVAILGIDAALFAGLPGNLKFENDGTIVAADMTMRTRLVCNNWKKWVFNSDWKNLRRTDQQGSRTFSGDVELGNGEGAILLTDLGENKFRYDFRIGFPAPFNFSALHLEIRLPLALREVQIDGKPFSLPENYEKTELMKYSAVHKLAIPVRDGSELLIQGEFRMMIQDGRKFGDQAFEIRICPEKISNDHYQLTLDMEIHRDRFAPDAVFRSPIGAAGIRTENEQWAQLAFKRDTQADSALDFSFLQDAPAGKYGFVTADADGHWRFANAPEKRARFYGGNLSWRSPFLEKTETDRVAAELVKLGYNWVRTHQHDTQMLPVNATDSTQLDPAMLEKWDYFVWRMKENGIYFTTDLYSSRRFLPTDPGLAEYAAKYRVLKPLLPFSRAAMENWKAFSRNLLTHVNPYTGMALKDDPTLVCLNLVNEEGLAYVWNNPATVKLYEKAFQEYCAANGYTNRKMEPSDRIFLKFLDELQRKVLEEQIAFVKNEIGVKCPVTSINAEPQVHWTIARSVFDVVDTHLYYAHPAWPKGGMIFPQAGRSNLVGEDCGGFVKTWLPSRLWGKPAISTEFRYCWPSLYRNEQGPLIGAYAALQDWDGLCGYGYSEADKGLTEVRHIFNSFETCNDPLALFSDKIAILMFLRGDVAPAKGKVSARIPLNLLDREELPIYFPMEFRSLGMITGVGSSVDQKRSGMENLELADSGNPEAVADPNLRRLWRKGLSSGVFSSDTGEIELDSNRLNFRVVTPLTESLTASANGDMTGDFLRFSGVKVPTTVSAHSLDGKPLAESNSILIFHLTESANTGETYTDGSLIRQTRIGGLPLLVRRGSAEITLKNDRPYQVAALNCDGVTVEKFVSQSSAEGQHFTVRTDRVPGGVMAYHLTR